MALLLHFRAYYVDASGKKVEVPGGPWATQVAEDAAVTAYEAAHPGTGGYYLEERRFDQPGGVTPPPPPKPGIDLVVTALTVPSPTQGQPCTITAKIKNQGTLPTPDAVGVGVGLFVDGAQVSWVAPALPVAAGQELTLDTGTAPSTGGAWTPTKSGAAVVKAVVDDLLLITETDEGNNTRSVNVTVAAGVTPPPATGKPFVSTSSWNTKVPTGASFRTEPGLNQGGAYLNRDAYSGPVVVSSSSDPLVTMNLAPSWGWPAQTVSFHCPTNQSGASGTDGALVVIDGDQVYDFWQFTRQGPNNASCAAWAKSNRRTETGWANNHSFPAAGIHAAGSSLLAGLIRGSELTDPAIGHALAVGIRRNLASSQFVGEAIYSDGGGGPVPEGTHIAIPRNVPKPAGLNKQVSNLWDALVDYGAFVIDVADGVQSIYFWADPNSVPAGDAAAANDGSSSVLSSAVQIVA